MGAEMKRFALVLPFLAGLFSVAILAGPARAEPYQPDLQGGKYDWAVFAGGCFWCMESDFDHVKGVVATISGYTGGTVPDPGYERVSAGGTGHAESVMVIFDPTVVTYQGLLDAYWMDIDPLAKDAQFCDHGHQYRTAIFYHSGEQKKLAEDSKAALQASGKLQGEIQTEISPAGPFYAAEDYHQDYYKKNPVRYKFYRWNCGRDQRVRMLWGPQAGHMKSEDE
jgi:peptide-methionine (S)-S-oxide reductase